MTAIEKYVELAKLWKMAYKEMCAEHGYIPSYIQDIEKEAMALEAEPCVR